ncbi:Carboxypeptidase SOL1 [Citrus sinensis]|nr:Carboxypeptidase SOL1 [Citrus sinensis]
MKLIFSLLFFFFNLNFSSVLARGPERSLLSTSFSGSTGHLFEGNPSETSFDKAKGHVTNAELEKAVKEFRQRCSNISRICCIGKSVSGFPLWVIEILDKPGVEEPEPPFKFIGNVHGDEPVGRELLILLANWICNNHMKDPLVRLIAENMHLHIFPSMNPDGYALKRRGNENNTVLNRDFPYQFFPMNNGEVACQPETRAIMS